MDRAQQSKKTNGTCDALPAVHEKQMEIDSDQSMQPNAATSGNQQESIQLTAGAFLSVIDVQHPVSRRYNAMDIENLAWFRQREGATSKICLCPS